MLFLRTSLIALGAAVAIAGCSGGKATGTSGSSGSTSASTSAAAANDLPEYPGAMTQAAGSGTNGGTTAAGKGMSTGDSFDKVYGWYQQKMPSGSERSHITSPIQTAVFTIGETSTGQSSVTLTTQGDRTIITIAKVKV